MIWRRGTEIPAVHSGTCRSGTCRPGGDSIYFPRFLEGMTFSAATVIVLLKGNFFVFSRQG